MGANGTAANAEELTFRKSPDGWFETIFKTRGIGSISGNSDVDFYHLRVKCGKRLGVHFASEANLKIRLLGPSSDVLGIDKEKLSDGQQFPYDTTDAGCSAGVETDFFIEIGPGSSGATTGDYRLFVDAYVP